MIKTVVVDFAFRALFVFGGLFMAFSALHAKTPLALHHENPHYFVFREKPTVIITSGEHYGMLLNRDFDYKKYLNTLADDGLNCTRVFSGTYCEETEAFNIQDNTLAPLSGKLLAPWARSNEPGYIGGGNKFDLTRWDDEYFGRLKNIMREADKCGIIIEFVLFCPMYDNDNRWKYSPMNSTSNVNNIGNVSHNTVYTLDTEPALLKAQEELVRKIVNELNEFDNIYFEVCNEPYFGGVTQGWHDHIAEVIQTVEKTLPNKHLISWNVQNGHSRIDNPHKAYSIFNFHYASPPTAVTENYELNKVIGLNETGFQGTEDDYYRHEAWEFIMAGGGLYNNLDYSFSIHTPEGTRKVSDPTPGGGGVNFRKQMRILKQFIESFDFVKMQPDTTHDVNSTATYSLSEPGKQYAIYIRDTAGDTGNSKLAITLPVGSYAGSWLNPVSGEKLEIAPFKHENSVAKEFSVPESMKTGVALRLISE
ncbi:MAG: cellulase family glycosylhydrolase [Thermoguttaceae bacterium]